LYLRSHFSDWLLTESSPSGCPAENPKAKTPFINTFTLTPTPSPPPVGGGREGADLFKHNLPAITPLPVAQHHCVHSLRLGLDVELDFALYDLDL